MGLLCRVEQVIDIVPCHLMIILYFDLFHFSYCLILRIFMIIYLFRQDVSWDPVWSLHEDCLPIYLEVEGETLHEKIYSKHVGIEGKTPEEKITECFRLRRSPSWHRCQLQEALAQVLQSLKSLWSTNLSSFTWTQLFWWQCLHLDSSTLSDHKALGHQHHLATRV